MHFEDYGFDRSNGHGDQGMPARVIAVHRDRYKLICERGECYGRLKTREYYVEAENFPTAGDFVLILYNPSGDCMIVKTLPRRTVFTRKDPDPGRGEQAVAANFDYVFIMQSLNHDFNPKRLERYLTLAWQSGAQPVVVLTKADLVSDYTEQLRTAEIYAMGTPVHAVSAQTGYGMDALSAYLRSGKTVVFLGSSGVGKSSLVNALAGEEIMATGGIREDDSRGRHTTTHRELIMLPNGAMIIDTPGMRALGMWDVGEGIGNAFADVEQYLGCCKYSDCRHQSEPGCRSRWPLSRESCRSRDGRAILRSKKRQDMQTTKRGFCARKGSGTKQSPRVQSSSKRPIRNTDINMQGAL